MTKSGFDIDELAKLATEADDLAANMAEIVKEWERDEPRDDWFLHQHDHADAVKMMRAQSTVIRELLAQNAQLKDALTAALAPLDDVGIEIEDALVSEKIFTWGPDGERFERMFEVVMQSRRKEHGEQAA